VSKLTQETREKIGETLYIRDEEEGQEYLVLLRQARGQHGRIARRGSGGPFVLLPPFPPPLSRNQRYSIVFGRGTREQRRERLRRLRIKQMAELYDWEYPPSYLGE